MKITSIFIGFLVFTIVLFSCGQEKKDKEEKVVTKKVDTNIMEVNNADKRISLHLNSMQQQHQLKNMRSHLEAVQDIVKLLSEDKYDEASKVAYTKLGSTTEMKLMCASFGNENFENLGLDFHKSADKMSEVFKNKNKNTSLKALSNTINYCVQCHTTFKQQ